MSKNCQQHPALDRFDVRARSYSPRRVDIFNQANRNHPQVRETERQHLVRRLDLQPGITVCDVGSGGGYLAEAIDQAMHGEISVICVENSTSFLNSIDNRFQKVLSSLCDIDLLSCSVDRVSCLAGLHHQERKQDFFREAHRILKPEGVVVVGDVLEGSPPAKFLNISVDRYTDIGHDGMFLDHGELTKLIVSAGFDVVDECYEQYTWDFPDWDSIVKYCKTLFRMQKASQDQMRQEILEHLPVSEGEFGVRLHWSLVYATGRKYDRE